MAIEDKNIPAQQKGNHVDIIQQIKLKNRQDAEKLYAVARTRLLDMSNWSKVADGPSSEFQLTDWAGKPVTRLAQKGDKFKINLPGPGSIIGDGNDWVEIEHIQNEHDTVIDTEITSVRVRPTQNPQKENPDVAHFFTSDATSTFLVKRAGDTVTAEVHGRNEVPNRHAEKFIDSVRHVVVAMGAIFGFAKPQWQNLVDGLIDSEGQDL